MKLESARSAIVDGRPVQVFDGLLPDPGNYAQALATAPFRRSEQARADTPEYRHWASETPVDVLARQPIGTITAQAVMAATGGARYRPFRAYTNSNAYGDMLFSHVDCAPDVGDVTALWYLCDRWDFEWGGETVFFDARQEIAFSVLPRPGRLVVFDGAILHCGRPPARICYGPRFTFAIKYERVAG
ncbi:2OG-Fe(II) oxygenase [Coralloluteibacterium stylophorae]|uniref:2OG-Fe(II) oxygenase n=1 Tax=Coralloluteibacterium stylophorae TaxID=1776034 RepID=A0A8J8AZ72_9GAMM|nr:2OG-Fe(II) oxygenase [Coralloluteibacterium stylophorae]MBS7456067.1 2OG-Fe(II) oxygenase [Coralloluteibacterium stylophorae]